jgi:hypothetical protein
VLRFIARRSFGLHRSGGPAQELESFAVTIIPRIFVRIATSIALQERTQCLRYHRLEERMLEVEMAAGDEAEEEGGEEGEDDLAMAEDVEKKLTDRPRQQAGGRTVTAPPMTTVTTSSWIMVM